MGDKLLPHQVAAILGVTTDRMRSLEREGKLPADRIGGMRVFTRRDVEKLRLIREKQSGERVAVSGSV